MWVLFSVFYIFYKRGIRGNTVLFLGRISSGKTCLYFQVTILSLELGFAYFYYIICVCYHAPMILISTHVILYIRNLWHSIISVFILYRETNSTPYVLFKLFFNKNVLYTNLNYCLGVVKCHPSRS